MAQFDISPYHWPGWVQAALAATIGALTLMTFVETRSLPRAKTVCPSLKSLKMEIELRNLGNNSNFAVSYPIVFTPDHYS